MEGPFKSVADLRRWADELDHPNCPVGIRTRQLRAERERQARKEREAREQQQQTANNWENWWNLIDERIRQHFALNFERNAEGRAGPLTDAIGAAIGHSRGKMRKEFEAAIPPQRLNSATRPTPGSIGLLEKTWEPVGGVLEQFREETHEQARGELQTAVTALRDDFNAATSRLQTEINTRLARLPLVKTWEDRVHYAGDVVVCDGATYQAKCDTGRPVTSDDWILLARGGVNGADGRSPNFKGSFNAHEKYRQLDVVEYDGGCLLALHDDPGIPGDPGWQVLSKRGHRGPVGETGPRGQRGARGPRGEAAPTIINWTIDHARYRAIPTMSDGTGGPPLELRVLFEQFLIETGGVPAE